MKQLLLALSVSVSLSALAGCSGSQANPVAAANQTQSPEALLANAIAILNEDRPTVSTYRSAIQQLNNYVDQKREFADRLTLSRAERELIEGQILKGVNPQRGPLPDSRESRMKELERKSFTALDAHHLDSCFLFRDAARALENDLGTPPASNDPARTAAWQHQLARHAFEWVIRQIAFQRRDPATDPWPAHEILRRGTGDGEERGRVFLALLEQMELPACLVARQVETEDRGQRVWREVPWTVGVLLGGQLHLFEPRLGVPVPGPQGGVATLKDVKANPAVLQKLYEGDPDPVTPAQVEKAVLLVPSSLPALSPRMRELQARLDDAGQRMRAVLYEDLTAHLERLKDANLGAEVRLWTTTAGYPAVVLPRYIENPLGQPRTAPRLARAPGGGVMWVDGVVVPRSGLVPEWARRLSTEILSGKSVDAAGSTDPLFKVFDSLFLKIRSEPGGIRDLLVRGKPEQAINKIVETESKLDKELDRFHHDLPDPTEFLRAKWARQLKDAEGALLELNLRRRQVPPDSPDGRALEEAFRKQMQVVETIWRSQETAINYLNVEWANPVVREHLAYFMGLAKMELAIRAELQAARQASRPLPEGQLTVAQQYGSAAEWFRRYQGIVLPRTRNLWGLAVERHLQTCEQAQQRLAARK
jgi:hypothetical protein